MSHRMTARTCLLAIVLLSMAGCAEPELTNPPNFPQMRRGPVGLEGDLVGELVLENGCFRLRKINGYDYLLIWPPTFEMTDDGRGVRITDESGASLSFYVGEDLLISGGGSRLDHVETIVAQPIPSDCLGPYWLVGREIWIYSE